MDCDNSPLIKIGSVNFSNLRNIDIFLQTIIKYQSNYYLKHNGYVVNAKSVLGIMSLDLTNNLDLFTEEETSEEEIEKLQKELSNKSF